MSSDRKYIITTGYWSGKGHRGQDGNERAEFFKLWIANTKKYSNPEKIIVINSNAEIVPDSLPICGEEWVNLSHNFGHVFDVFGTDYRNKFVGWSIGYILGAMLSYSNNCDFIYKEQDCLAFGPWVDLLYSNLEKYNKKMLVGRESYPGMIIEQSLTIIKHEFILEYLKELFNIDKPDGGDGRYVTEFKCAEICSKRHSEIGFMDMGYGRKKPFNIDECFYIQQPSEEDLNILMSNGLIESNNNFNIKF